MGVAGHPLAGGTAGGPDGTSARTLGFWSGTALVVASMLGTGVFTTSGFLLADLGSPGWVLVAWVLGGVIATLGALSYGALARQLPESGGEYLFLSRTLHPSAGYVAGWISLLVGFSAPLAAAAVAFGQYSASWWPALPVRVTGSLLLLLLTGLHAWNVSAGVRVQNLAVLVKVLLVVGFVVFGASRAGPVEHAPAPVFSPTALALALMWVSFSYSGWNAAVYVGGEMRDADRTLPRCLLAGTLLVTVLYVCLNAVFVLAVPADQLSGRLEVGRITAEHLGGRRWAEYATALIAVALLTGVSAQLMAGPRVYARMAADGFLPRWLSRRDGPPRRAVVFQCLLALGMLWTASYESLLSYIGFTLGLSTAATVVGLMLLRWRRGTSVPVPGWPWVPVAFVAAVLATTSLAIVRAPLASAGGLATLALGWLAWRWQTRGQAGA